MARLVVIVAPGETLAVLARRHGTTPHALAVLNRLPSVHHLRPGQHLTLPQTD